MGYAVKIYEAFRDLGEDKAQILADFVEYVESRKAATSLELKESELRLTKAIEEVRKEIKEVELKLSKEIEETKLEIEQVRKEIKDTELKLTKEIEKSKAETIKWMFLFWIGQVVSIIAIIKWLFIH